jgi:exodeoxyribonuclease VII large subunit
MEELALGDDSTRTVAQLYDELTGYLDAAWGRAHQVWVLGEVQKLLDHRSGHGYLDLVDPSVPRRDVPTLKAKCWRTTWGPLKASLRRAGLAVGEGSVVRVRGYVDVYAPRGELSFIVTALDVEALRLATLGEHAKRREALLRALESEGLLEANRALPLPAVPLRVGLIASRGTEGYNDFLGMLDGSGLAFSVTHARVSVQGADAPGQVARALRLLGEAACDVVCVVRGGGSQGDLAAFDDERVARAIAASPVCVLTGIGHTGDVSVADLVAHQHYRTPTACAEGLVAIVRAWYAEHVAGAAARVAEATAAILEERTATVDQSRRHLVVSGRLHVRRADDALAAAAAAAARHGPLAVRRAGHALAATARPLVPLARRRLDGAAGSLASRRALLAAYDPARLLAHGWSITTAADGRVVRSVADLSVGDVLATRLADGVARSTVSGVEVAPEEGS